MKNCLISIVMPVFNAQNTLMRAIDSVVNQTSSNWELIIVDDGSTDQSADLYQAYAGDYNNIKIERQENQGVAAARNNGINYASGDYICFLDSDDYIETSLVEKMEKIIKNHQPDMISFGYHLFKEEDNEIVQSIDYLPVLNGLYTKKEFIKNFSKFEAVSIDACWLRVIKKRMIRQYQLNFPNLKVGEDAMFCYRAYQALDTIYILPELLYHYDWGPEESAMKTYDPNSIEIGLERYESYEQMLKTWGIYENSKDSILAKYLHFIVYQFVNLNRRGCNLTLKEKVGRINYFTSMPKIQKLIKEMTLSNGKTLALKIFIFLLKAKQYRLLLVAVKKYLQT